MEYFLLGSCVIFFGALAWYRFRLAIGAFIICLPVWYSISDQVVKFHVGPLPTTLIEVSFGALFLVWLIRYARHDVGEIKKFLVKYRLFSIFGLLFLGASLVSIGVSGNSIPALGIWRAYFLEPVVLFLIMIGRVNPPSRGVGGVFNLRTNPSTPPLAPLEGGFVATPPNLPLVRGGNVSSSPAGGGVRGDGSKIHTQFLVWSLVISTVSIALFGIYQHLAGADTFSQGLGKPVIHRVASLFTSPNAVGLYIVPILFLLIGLIVSAIGQSAGNGENLKEELRKRLKDYKFIGLVMIGVLNVVVLALTKSDGALLAVVGGVLVLLFFLGFRKSVIALVIVGTVLGLSIPRIREAVLFRDPPGQNRLALWSYAWNYVTASPYQFVLGAGLRQFNQKVQGPAQNFDYRKRERLIYPHNVLFNFWTEIGLLGMVSFVTMMGYLAYLGIVIWKKEKRAGAVVLAMLVGFLVQGLVDVPYFKNDLAILWWVLAVVVFLVHNTLVFTNVEIDN